MLIYRVVKHSSLCSYRKLLIRYHGTKCTFASQLFQPQQELGSKELLESVSQSHKLLSMSGLIENTTTGTILLPLIVRSLEKLIKIIDEEMIAIGANKIMMPSFAPISLFKKSGRWDTYKNDVYTVDGNMLLSPTHEEVVTNLVTKRNQNKFPLLLYQITTKYRKEKRPRSGLLRAREFLMKDLYSFDAGHESGIETYQAVCKSYEKIFERLNLPVIKVTADPGDMGGQYSHEYQLLTDAGQDDVMICSSCGHCFNQELLTKDIAQSTKEQTTMDTSGLNQQQQQFNQQKVKCLNCGSESIDSMKGIEVGHTFLLGTRYSQPFNACYKSTNTPWSSTSSDNDSKEEFLTMGSYGLGVTRLLAASLEVLSEDTTPGKQPKMIWPSSIAPFDVVVILPKSGSNEEKAIGSDFGIKFAADIAQVSGLDVLIDDRTNKTIGKRIKDHTQLGIPATVILGKGTLDSIPKFELMVKNSNQEDRRILDHSEIIHYFRILSMKNF